jgi:sodium-dependent dicarboxylate transporter 2/3/5
MHIVQRTRWWIVFAAGIAALVVALIAPAPWPDGERSVEIAYDGPGTVTSRVEHGDTTRVFVQIAEHEAAIRPDLADVQINLVLPDGSRELVPILRWDAGERELVAERHAPTQLALALALLAAVVILWVSEAIPLWVSSLIVPLVLVIAGAQGAREALAPFFHPIIALFFGGFLMAEAMRRAKLDRRVALLIVVRAGKSPATLFAALLGTSAFLSMWMSNTASTALLVPIAIAVTEPLGNLGYKKAVVLGIAYAATLGGVGSAIGTPANPIAMEFLGQFAGEPISFVGWFAIGLPMVVLFLPVVGFYLWRRSRIRIEAGVFDKARAKARQELAELGSFRREELIVLSVFLLVLGTWLTQQWHGLNTGIVAVGGAVLLAIFGRLKDEDLARISWSSLLTFGGGLALGSFIVQSGTSDWVAARFVLLAGLPAAIGVTAVALLALVFTAFASNTASAAILIPLSIPLAGILGVDARTLVLIVAVASSIDFALVIGTPPTMIAFSTRLFTAREIFRTGILLDLAGVLLLVTVVASIWRIM